MGRRAHQAGLRPAVGVSHSGTPTITTTMSKGIS